MKFSFSLSLVLAACLTAGAQPPAANPGLGIIGEAPTKAAKGPTAAPAELADVVLLLPQDVLQEQTSVPLPSFFRREIARQTFWIAATHEFNLRALDGSLDETVPARLPADRNVRLQERQLSKTERWTVTANGQKVWAGMFNTDQAASGTVRQWVEESEKRSRTFAKSCFEAAGYKPVAAKMSDAAVPADVAKRLWVMREFDQFAAVRQLHYEIRTKGESDALIEALAIGYANLGLLTEHHWMLAPMVFKARGLLYAQRFAARMPQSARGFRVRAYAFGLAGMHLSALHDLDTALQMKDADTTGTEWLEPLEGLLKFDRKRVANNRTVNNTALVRFFEYLVDEEPLMTSQLSVVGNKLFQKDPEIYRTWDTFSRNSPEQQRSDAAAQIFRVNLPARLAEQPGLPKAAIDALRTSGIRGVWEELLKGSEADRGTPAYSVLGGIVREIHFTQSIRRLEAVAIQNKGGAPELAAEMTNEFKTHPFLGVISSFEIQTVELPVKPGSLKASLETVPVRILDIRGDAWFKRMRSVDNETANNWLSSYGSRPEPLYYQQSRVLRAMGPTMRAETKSALKLRQISPFSPIAAAMMLADAGANLPKDVANVEKNYSEHPVVWKALRECYQAAGKKEDSLRCWAKSLEAMPDWLELRGLSIAAKQQGDLKTWRWALDFSLEKTNPPGLFPAQYRVDIAHHLMDRREFKEAEPYAKAAAESFSEWSLHCYALCLIGLGKPDEANELLKLASANYVGYSPIMWYLYSKAYPGLDGDAARKAFDKLIENGKFVTGNLVTTRVAQCYLLSGDKKKAMEWFEDSYKRTASPAIRLSLAMTADMMKDVKRRDEELAKIEELEGPTGSYRFLANAMKDWSKKEEPPTEEELNKLLKNFAPGVVAEIEVYIGWYLQNRGFTGRALVHWKRCRDGSGAEHFRTFAAGLIVLHAPKDPKRP